MHDSSFRYQYSTVSPRGAREGPGEVQHPLAPLRSAYGHRYYHRLLRVLSMVLSIIIVLQNWSEHVIMAGNDP